MSFIVCKICPLVSGALVIFFTQRLTTNAVTAGLSVFFRVQDLGYKNLIFRNKMFTCRKWLPRVVNITNYIL